MLNFWQILHGYEVEIRQEQVENIMTNSYWYLLPLLRYSPAQPG